MEQATFDPNAFGTPEAIASLAAKIAEVMGAVDRIAKSGHNDHFNYDFARESDVLDAVRKELATRKVALLPYLEESASYENVGRNGTTRVAVTRYRFTFYDGETGASLVARVQSEGMDGQDKGSTKALTAAVKSFLLKAFLIPTGDDPDAAAPARTTTARAAPARTLPPRQVASAPSAQPAPSAPPRPVAPSPFAAGQSPSPSPAHEPHPEGSPPVGQHVGSSALPPGPASEPSAEDRALDLRESATLAEALTVMGPTEARKSEGKSAVAAEYKGLGYRNYDDFVARGARHLPDILRVARRFDRSPSGVTT